MMQNIALTISEPRQWDGYYSTSGDEDVLFVPTTDATPVGADVRVNLTFLQGPQFFLNGVVIWRRPASKGQQRLRPGVGVRLHGSETSKIGYVRGFARGGLLDKRASPRLPVRLHVTYKTSSARRMNFTRNITESGVLLAAAEVLPKTTSVALVIIMPLDLPPMKLLGTVVRHLEDEAGKAMGIRLDFANPDEEHRFSVVVRDLERAFNQGRLEEKFIAK
jgi:Tfp pilus assembly protein PilZ